MQQANKGKPINTSVPSIAIRFHANAEEIEELYQSEEESTDKTSNEKAKPTGGLGDPESSPLRSYLPRLGKRSTSIDTSLTQDSSPPSDRWKFFTEIKGKITKSVEDTITEIKHRNQESDSTSKKFKLPKDKDNSSLSDSEDLSESSISKTCGVVSTTEGVEMSSDDETPSLEKDKKPAENSKQKSNSCNSDTGLKQKLKINRKKKPSKESNIGIKTLAHLYEINTGLRARTSMDKSCTSEENIEEVESGVEAFEDVNLQPLLTSLPTSGTEESDLTSTASDIKLAHRASTDEEIISSLVEQIDNLEVDDTNVLNIQQISGTDIRRGFLSDNKNRTFLAPEGFVDLRSQNITLSWFDVIYNDSSYRYVIGIFGVLLFYFWISIPIYFSGFIAGTLFTLAVTWIYNKFYSLNTSTTGLVDQPFNIPSYNSQTILEIPAVKEYQPVTKFEGWMNEYPDLYDPQTYHICQTQSVYIRLQGNLLRISHTRAKIPKRAMWNEAKHKLVFTQHRIYNLLGAKVHLLPEGLNKRRHWSKKYPICITLNKDQLDFEVVNSDDKFSSDEKIKNSNSETSVEKNKTSFLRKRKFPVQMATHVCAIIHGSESHLPELPPNPSYYKRICRAFRKTTLVSPKNPLCRIYFKSYAAITFERKRHVKCDLLHIIHPFSLFRIYWELWMMLVFFCALIINPLEVAFDFETSDQLDLLTVVVVMIDFICIIDITLTFFTGYGIDSTKEVVLDPGKIARNYIFSTAFVGDVLSSVPIKLIRYFLQSFFTKSTWRTVNIFSLLKILRFNTLIHYMGRAADMWQVSLIAFLIIRYSIIMILVIHWTACMHYAVPAIVRAMTGVLHEKSWIVQSNIDAYPTKFIIYIHCLFRACCYLLTITHGMYEPFTSEDILVGIATFIVGTIMLSLVLVLMLQIMASIFSAETKYQEIINQVEEYMGYKQLPLNMQRRLISYYEYRFQKKYFREDAISATLSERLRREINVFCYRRLVDSVSIFKDMPQHIVVDIVNSLKAEIFLPNDIIVKAGTIGECMYFLASGTVCVVTPTGKEPQIFSKLTEEEEEFELESGSSRPSSPSPPEENSPDVSEEMKLNEDDADLLKEVFEDEEQPDDDILSLEDWTTFTPEEDSPTETHIYLFGRTDREKEDWFRRFATATHQGAHLSSTENLNSDVDGQTSVSDTLLAAAKGETDYLKYMAKFQKSAKKKQASDTEETDQTVNVLWINALIGRVLFDCIRDDTFTNRLKDRIQRKLSSIKLPYFIEQLSVSELSLGSSPPLIHKASKPVLDQRGLWVDLDITYDGIVVLTLQTKLNLMKLKQPPSTEATFDENPSAKWQNSDVDDTAESSTDDEAPFIPTTKVLDDMGNPVLGLGGTSNTSKKFIKMVDKIAESKFFQAATENRYIKKAMEGVSNTDLGLKVELKGLVGTLVLNMPPPPSDRVWVGFRPKPELWLTAQPIVGERNISFLGQLTNWIEKKLSQEFQKVLVIPNMEDIVIPVMSPKLPE